MTNIGAIKVVQTGEDGKPKSSLVFGVDSQSTSLDAREKGDQSQKLYCFGRDQKYLLAGTGSRHKITSVVQEVSRTDFADLGGLIKAIFRIVPDLKLEANEYLNFIVGGNAPRPEGNAPDLDIAHVVTFGKPNDKGGVEVKTEYAIQNRILDGSGSRFVGTYLEGIAIAGIPSVYKDVVSAMVNLFDFAKTGARDLGVNDKLQFGIMNRQGISLVYHPDIYLITEEFYSAYVKTMLGLDPIIPTSEPSPAEVRKINDRRTDIAQIFRAFYQSLETDLATHNSARKDYTQVSQLLPSDREKYKHAFEDALDRVSSTERALNEGVQAFLNRGREPILAYIEQFRRREKERFDRTAAYVAPQVPLDPQLRLF